MPDIFDQVTVPTAPATTTAPLRVRGRTVGDIFDQVTSNPSSLSFGDVLKSGAQGLGDLVTGVAGALTGDMNPAAQLPSIASRVAKYYAESPDTAASRSKLSAVPVVGPALADISAPALAYSSGNRPPSRQENMDAIRAGTSTAAGLAAPPIAGRMSAAANAAAPDVAPDAASTTTASAADPNTPFYGDEGARGPLDTTLPKPAPPPPTKMQQAAKAIKTGVGIVRHPILSGATKAAEIVADRLAPTTTSGRTLPPPSTPDAVAGLQLDGDAPMEPPPPPTMAGIPTAAQTANARASIAKQQTLLTPLDTNALPPSQMQPTSAITSTAPPTAIPTSSRQIALENAVNDYAPPTEPQIPAPRPIARKTAQLEINGEPVGKRVPYASQLPEPTPTIESARVLAEQRLARQQAHQQATLAIARDTMKSESYPQWALEDQKDFGKAVNAGDPGAAAAISSRAAQQTAGVDDPAFGAIHRLPVSSVIEAYRGNGIYIDPDGKFTQIDPQADIAVDSGSNDR